MADAGDTPSSEIAHIPNRVLRRASHTSGVVRMGRLRIAVVVLVLLLLAQAGAASAYPWPFKPFDQQHPIRGFFGDPRTVYDNGILSTPFVGLGAFSFHQGVDISAPDGTPIYPSEDGTAHYIGSAILNVVTDHDVVFQYFHIVPVVGEGDQVTAGQTVLGYVQPPFGHVHVSEIDGTKVVNPLQPGHLEPYRDFTKPVIREILIRDQTGDVQAPLGLCGRIGLAVDAYDLPPVAVPGKFKGLPVAPSLVRWTLTRLGSGPVVPWRTAADYDTTAISNGVYIVTVLVGDGHGHTVAATQRFSVLNSHSGICPGSLPAPPGTPPPGDEEPPPPAAP
jgi:hypothetical protein